jgi:hypothetical protein
MDKMPFCHLIQYCKSKPLKVIAKIQRVSANPTGIKYKFGIQVPKGIIINKIRKILIIYGKERLKQN